MGNKKNRDPQKRWRKRREKIERRALDELPTTRYQLNSKIFVLGITALTIFGASYISCQTSATDYQVNQPVSSLEILTNNELSHRSQNDQLTKYTETYQEFETN